MGIRNPFTSARSTEQPPPDGWWRDLDDEELEYLNEQGLIHGREVAAEADRQERKATILMGWSLALISASGLFGDLDLGSDPVGAASWAGLALTGALAMAATYVFWPRGWSVGIDFRWLAGLAGDGARELRGNVVDALVDSYLINFGIARRRSSAITLMSILVPLQTLAIVAVEVLAQSASATPLAG